MKLNELQVITKVSTGNVGDYTNRLMATQGWDITVDFTKGVVFASRNEHKRIVPFSNVAYMCPFIEVEAKPVKKAEPKAVA